MEAKSIESRYMESVPSEHRKKYAQFFTPQGIADFMASWVAGAKCLRSALEPAFGLGIFSRSLLKISPSARIDGFDVDETILGYAERDFENERNVILRKGDYIFGDWDKKYDGIICNPPYLRFHSYANKEAVEEVRKNAGVDLNGTVNLYSLFLVKSLFQLGKGGRCAYIVPTEFLNADYGTAVKEYVLNSKALREIIVFDGKKGIFGDAMTTSCILLLENDGRFDGNVRFVLLDSDDSIKTENGTTTLDARETYEYGMGDLDASAKWRKYYKPSTGLNFDGCLVPFTKFARASRGIATGANKFFTFSREKAGKCGIREELLSDCVCHCKDVDGYAFTEGKLSDLKEKGKDVFLLNAKDTEDDHVAKYLRNGAEEGISRRYLTSKRNPWYVMERREPSPIWVSVFNRKGIRFVRNMTDALCLTTFHCIYVNYFYKAETDLIFAYLISNTAKRIFGENCREYGNGLMKFEPNDLNNSMVLNLDKLPLEEKLAIMMLYRKNIDNPPIEKIDAILESRFNCR